MVYYKNIQITMLQSSEIEICLLLELFLKSFYVDEPFQNHFDDHIALKLRLHFEFYRFTEAKI